MKNFLVLLILTFCSCKTQDNIDTDVKSLIFSLNNKSVIINPNYVISYSLDEKANKVLQLKSESKFNFLIKNMKMHDKALISHIMLTKLIEPKKDIFKYEYIYDKNGEIVSTIYTLNKMKWEYINDEAKILNYKGNELYKYWKETISKSNL